MSFQIRKAVRQRRPLKVSLEGLSGSGKTYTALRLAFAMKRAGIGSKIAVADSENSSAGLYSDITEDGERWEFDVIDLPNDKQNPLGYAEAYGFLVESGYDIIIMDSLSHAWHGAQEIIDRIAAESRNKDKFAGWATVTPMQREMLQTLTDHRAHCIVTMRVKGEYERVEENGKTKIKKVGMKTDQREGSEYEFDLVMRLEQGQRGFVEKVRGCTAMNGKQCHNPGPDFFKPLFDWWKLGADYKTPLQEHCTAIEEAETPEKLKEAFAKAWKDSRLSKAEKDQAKGLYDRLKAPAAPSTNGTPGDPDSDPFVSGELFQAGGLDDVKAKLAATK